MQNSSMPKRPEPGAPTITSSTIMFASRMPPLSGMKLSCILLTAPSEEAVETFAKSADAGNAETYLLAFHVPRTDFVSDIRLGLYKGKRGIAACFQSVNGADAEGNRIAMTARRIHPSRSEPVMRPKQLVNAAPSTNISNNSTKLVSGVGFSKGCAELTLKKPPPSPLKSLMASCEATGPRAIVCVAPSRVVAPAEGAKVCGTPCVIRKSAASTQIGRRTYRVPRVRSTQKLPMVDDRRRAKPRISAMATAIPDAAGKKRKNGDAGHLAQIAQRRLAPVRLPARVGDEAHRGIERQIG